METKKYASLEVPVSGPTFQRRGRSIRINLVPSKKKSALASKFISMGELFRSRSTQPREGGNDPQPSSSAHEPADKEATPKTTPTKKHRSFLRRVRPSKSKSGDKIEDTSSDERFTESHGDANLVHILNDLAERESEIIGPCAYDESEVVDGRVPLVYDVTSDDSADSLLKEILTDSSSLDTSMEEEDNLAFKPAIRVDVPFGTIKKPGITDISDSSESSKTASDSEEESTQSSADIDFRESSRTRRGPQRRRNRRNGSPDRSAGCSDIAIDSLSSLFWMLTGTTEEKNGRDGAESCRRSKSMCWFDLCVADSESEDEASVNHKELKESQEALKRMLSDAMMEGGSTAVSALEHIRQKAVAMTKERVDPARAGSADSPPAPSADIHTIGRREKRDE